MFNINLSMQKKILFILLAMNTQFTVACTTVFWNQGQQPKVVGRSMDFYESDQPNILVFPRGIARTNTINNNSLQWKSKYGNVVVTAYETNAVSDGMNEQGLSAHLLYSHQAQYEARDNNRPALSSALWAQYVLDNFKTVKEVLAASKKMQIVGVKLHGKQWPSQLAIEDASGDAAVIEFRNGEMKVYHGPQYRVISDQSNDPVQTENIKNYQLVNKKLMENNMTAMMDVLSTMRHSKTHGEKNTWSTRWVTASDLSNKTYYFNAANATHPIWLNLQKLNFAEGSPILTIDPADKTLQGDVSGQLKPVV